MPGMRIFEAVLERDEVAVVLTAGDDGEAAARRRRVVRKAPDAIFLTFWWLPGFL